MQITKREARRLAEIKGIRDAYQWGYDAKNPYHKGGRSHSAWVRGWLRGMQFMAFGDSIASAISFVRS